MRRLQGGANKWQAAAGSIFLCAFADFCPNLSISTSGRYSVNGISTLLIQKRARVVEEVGAIKREAHLAVNFEKSVGETEAPYV